MPEQASPTPPLTPLLGKWCVSGVCTCHPVLCGFVSAIAERNSRRAHLLNVISLVRMWNVSLCLKAVTFILWVMEMGLEQGLGETRGSAG